MLFLLKLQLTLKKKLKTLFFKMHMKMQVSQNGQTNPEFKKKKKKKAIEDSDFLISKLSIELQ